MHLQWLGQTCVKLQTKNLDEDVTILIDPYRPAKGEFPRSFSPQIALFSHGTTDAVTLSQDPFVLSTLGECETKNVMIYALPSPTGQVIFKLNAEGLNIVHLGALTAKIDNGELAKIGSVDILFIPVGGGKNYLSPEDAAAMVTTLEPRIVVPMAYQCDTDPGAEPITQFIKEMGLKPDTTDKKIIVKQKDLPQDETKLFVLEKNY